MKGIAKKVEAIREELKKPIPEPQNPEESKKMSKKKVSKKKASKKKSAKRVEKKAAASGITLATLAKEAGVNGQKARQKLRAAGIERGAGGRWSFPEKSKALKAARSALDLK